MCDDKLSIPSLILIRAANVHRAPNQYASVDDRWSNIYSLDASAIANCYRPTHQRIFAWEKENRATDTWYLAPSLGTLGKDKHYLGAIWTLRLNRFQPQMAINSEIKVTRHKENDLSRGAVWFINSEYLLECAFDTRSSIGFRSMMNFIVRCLSELQSAMFYDFWDRLLCYLPIHNLELLKHVPDESIKWIFLLLDSAIIDWQTQQKHFLW